MTKLYSTYEELVSNLQNATATMANEEVYNSRRQVFLPRQWRQEQTHVPSLPSSQMDWAPKMSNNQFRVNDRQDKTPRARWVSKDTIQARREARCCLRCGNSNHYQGSCLYLPAINPDRLIANNKMSSKILSPEILLVEPEFWSPGENLERQVSENE